MYVACWLCSISHVINGTYHFQLSICNNFLLRMHGVSRLTNIRVLALNNNGILQIEGLKDLIYLKALKLAGMYLLVYIVLFFCVQSLYLFCLYDILLNIILSIKQI